MKKNLSKKEALAELWRRGNLIWKLDEVQKELYNLFHDSDFKVQTWLLARRSGKTYTLCVLALEQCIRKPNSIVKFASPTKLQVNNNVRPIFKFLLEDCPEDVKPEFRAKDYIYYFPNGSEIQLAGTDNGHSEKLRGGDSHISIVDEAGSCSELNNLVKSILLPTTLITKGKVILASTPPRDPDHEFIGFIEEAELRGSLIKKTIDDNVRLTEEMKDELYRELGGAHTEEARRELFCELIKDSKTTVIPEATDDLYKKIVKEWPEPPFYDTYVSMDVGFKDLTVVLFGYFDFRADKVIIQDELVIAGNELHLPKLSKDILKKENTLWYNVLTNEVKEPYIRVSDINHIVMNDLRINSNGQLNFIPAKKDDKESAINTLRVMLSQHKIIIHPRCKTLLRHVKNAKWTKSRNKNDFTRSPDDGHYDALDALIYMIRHIVYQKNPYPNGYGIETKDLFVVNPERYENNNISVYKKLFNVKRKKYGSR